MRDAFIERGIAAERLGIISYGEVRPAVLGANEPAWAQNRRAVLVVVDELWRSNCGER
jgi:peptidoglycan-associated lipoprotein